MPARMPDGSYIWCSPAKIRTTGKPMATVGPGVREIRIRVADRAGLKPQLKLAA